MIGRRHTKPSRCARRSALVAGAAGALTLLRAAGMHLCIRQMQHRRAAVAVHLLSSRQQLLLAVAAPQVRLRVGRAVRCRRCAARGGRVCPNMLRSFVQRATRARAGTLPPRSPSLRRSPANAGSSLGPWCRPSCWGIALFEYVLQVPANRCGGGCVGTPVQGCRDQGGATTQACLHGLM